MTEKKVTIAFLAEMVQGELVGDGSIEICSFAPLDSAGQNDITFLAKDKKEELLADTKAGAVIVPLKVVGTYSFPCIKVADPYLAVAKIHTYLLNEEFIAEGVHPSAFVGTDCLMPTEVTVRPLAVIGNRVKLGKRVVVESGVVIGDDVFIGDDTVIKANVTVANGSILGRRVTIHSGTVIGSDGYGYATDAMGFHHKRPQVGIVRIDDDVEIGSNCSLDRAAYGVTWVKAGVKIDNQVQIAHNVVVGENSLIIAQSGIAGSTTLGRNVVVGGKGAIAGHLEIGDQVMIAGGGGVHNNQPRGAVVGGRPAIPIRQWGKAVAVFAKLPELHSDVRRLKKEIETLKQND